jgi:putative acetyltransferase
MDITIRKETPSDVAEIETLTASAFLNVPHSNHMEQFIINALRNSGKLTISLVAEVDKKIVGHVAISPVSISDGRQGWYGLGPISVTPEHQGVGIGSHLIRQALASLREMGASGCVLLGEPKYYSRFGFKAEPSLVLSGVPAEYFQVISFNTSIPVGTVTYHQSFYIHG